MSYLNEMCEIVREAGKLVLAPVDYAVREKSGFADFVTDRDIAVQHFLTEKFRALVPGAGFICEEEKVADPDRGYVFVIDPIDGTANFVNGYPHCGISVALCLDSIPVCGVIYNPYADELFCAEKGGEAKLNGKKISVTGKPLSKSLASFGTSPYNRELTDVSFEIAQTLFSECVDIRRGGSAALEYCDVACGRTAVMFELRQSCWDYCAARVIVEAAGGVFAFIGCDEMSSACGHAVVAGTREAVARFMEIAAKPQVSSILRCK